MITDLSEVREAAMQDLRKGRGNGKCQAPSGMHLGNSRNRKDAGMAEAEQMRGD